MFPPHHMRAAEKLGAIQPLRPRDYASKGRPNDHFHHRPPSVRETGVGKEGRNTVVFLLYIGLKMRRAPATMFRGGGAGTCAAGNEHTHKLFKSNDITAALGFFVLLQTQTWTKSQTQTPAQIQRQRQRHKKNLPK